MQNQIFDSLATSILEVAPTNLFSRIELENLLRTAHSRTLVEESKKHPSIDKSLVAMLANRDFDGNGKILVNYIIIGRKGIRPEGVHWDPIVFKLVSSGNGCN